MKATVAVKRMSEGPLVGVDVGVHLDAAFLLVRLRMAADTLEDEVGEKGNRRGVDDL